MIISTLVNYFYTYKAQTTIISKRKISVCYTSSRRQIFASKRSIIQYPVKNGRIELDSHADTIVAGSNCALLNYTGRECDVSPYTDSYSPIKNVPIVKAATLWQSPNTRQSYILVFNEALYMPDLPNSLINPNQLRHYGAVVQDDPTSEEPLHIRT
mgnify:FL=1